MASSATGDREEQVSGLLTCPAVQNVGFPAECEKLSPVFISLYFVETSCDEACLFLPEVPSSSASTFSFLLLEKNGEITVKPSKVFHYKSFYSAHLVWNANTVAPSLTAVAESEIAEAVVA